MHAATEVPLLLKSTPDMWDEIQARVLALHSCDTPSIIRRELTGVNDSYAEWVHLVVRPRD
ncbi:MAG: divalent cation tolerance protein CutA [Pseudomonadota bacterium]